MDAKLQELCRQAHEDRIRVGMLDTDTKNRTLELAADALMAHEQEILEANAIDMERGRERNMPQGLLDRLKLDHDRLLGMADGLRQVAKLEDPIGGSDVHAKTPERTDHWKSACSHRCRWHYL